MFDSLSSLANSKIKVFVSGASGFLGQYVVKLLQEEDHSVESIVCYDLKPYENTLGKLNYFPAHVMVIYCCAKYFLFSS